MHGLGLQNNMEYGIESISNLRAKIWDLLPRKIKRSSFPSVFKNKIREWIPEKCPCKLCQTYILFIHLFIYSFIHSFIHSFIYCSTINLHFSINLQIISICVLKFILPLAYQT